MLHYIDNPVVGTDPPETHPKTNPSTEPPIDTIKPDTSITDPPELKTNPPKNNTQDPDSHEPIETPTEGPDIANSTSGNSLTYVICHVISRA